MKTFLPGGGAPLYWRPARLVQLEGQQDVSEKLLDWLQLQWSWFTYGLKKNGR